MLRLPLPKEAILSAIRNTLDTAKDKRQEETSDVNRGTERFHIFTSLLKAVRNFRSTHVDVRASEI